MGHYFFAALFRGKADKSRSVISFTCCRIFLNRTIFYRASIRKRFIENDNEIIFEIIGNTAAIACSVTDHGIFFGYNFHGRSLIESIDQHIRLVRFGKRETKNCRSVGWGYFCRDIVVGQINTVIIRFCDLRFMRKPTGTFILIELRFTGHGHDGKLTVIVNPRAGLMGLLETPNFIGIVSVLPPIAHFTRLGRPEIHSPRKGNSRIGIAVG